MAPVYRFNEGLTARVIGSALKKKWLFTNEASETCGQTTENRRQRHQGEKKAFLIVVNAVYICDLWLIWPIFGKLTTEITQGVSWTKRNAKTLSRFLIVVEAWRKLRVVGTSIFSPKFRVLEGFAGLKCLLVSPSISSGLVLWWKFYLFVVVIVAFAYQRFSDEHV